MTVSRYSISIVLALLALAAHHSQAAELYRIRIQNRDGGLVQVSVNEGATYGAVGRVRAPANARIPGFAAASYMASSCVAATAVHGLRIKTGQYALGQGKAQQPMIFSVSPVEFWKIPEGYGGHRPRSSAILTDIPAGHSIFRNFAPYAGSSVFLERRSELAPLPQDYIPAEGHTIVIIVEQRDDAPTAIEFENRRDGSVTAVYSDGARRAIATVVRPVRGVGRYDGTTFTGVGSVNTNHSGVLTLSTAPVQPPGTVEGGPVETRGGFMVQPERHAAEQRETSPQVMVVRPVDGSTSQLEGTAPLFLGCIGLSRFEDAPGESCRVEVKIDDGAWEPAPRIVGKADDGLTAGYLRKHFAKSGSERDIQHGVTAIRLLLPRITRATLLEEFDRVCRTYASTIRPATSALRGTITLAAHRPLPRGRMINFYIDGVFVQTSNRHPYACEWDSTTVPDGLHFVEVEESTASGDSKLLETYTIFLDNN